MCENEKFDYMIVIYFGVICYIFCWKFKILNLLLMSLRDKNWKKEGIIGNIY